LRDVSFAVEPGSAVGLVGRNGSGKTTALRLLSGIVKPTSGHVAVGGRVGSLLELGAGFDPDMTARENIVMNAAMHGVRKSDAVRRTEAILEFADTGDFLDTPLKHFSSGMHMRLAFSCAINMDPQLLIADEVLAVGDLAFQERCLQRVQQDAERGLTVLFVSHDMEAITRVCTRVLWLHGGRVVKDGDPEEVVDEYQNATWQTADLATSEKGRHVNRFGRILAVNLISQSGKEVGGVRLDERCSVRIRVEAFITLTITECAMDLYVGNIWVMRAHADKMRRVNPGTYDVHFRIPANFLAQTNYSMNVSVTVRRKNDDRDYPLVMYRALRFMAYNSEAERDQPKKKAALLAPRLSWDIEAVGERPIEQGESVVETPAEKA
jgi:lipopolysaccharide transport system ATP-binding protein